MPVLRNRNGCPAPATAREATTQQRLEKKNLGVLEPERARMGRELQDGLCQELAAIAALSAALARHLAPGAARESAAARKIAQLARQSIRHALALARGL